MLRRRLGSWNIMTGGCMAPRTWPQRPQFANDAEQVVWDALRGRLRDVDVLMHGVRFTDPVDGEVEIDLLVLMPDLGAAIIEVKGGHITFGDGNVRQTRGDGTHVIHPADQAAKERRAFMRFLEHQPSWSRGRMRATWLVALPQTLVTGALGPALRREVIIGRDDLPDAAGIIYDRLRDPASGDRVPPGDWVSDALEHLVGAIDVPGEIQARAAIRLRHVEQLTAQQAALLSVMRRVPRFEVAGSAGTGKTWMAIEQARRWSAAGERVAFLAYTRGVTEAIRRAMADLPGKEVPAFIGTFFQLGYQWGARADGPDDPEFWSGRGPALMRLKASQLEVDTRFTAFVVDEAQDFSDSWWPALLAAGTPDAKLALFRDDEQAVFAERRGRPEVDLVPLVVDENLRNAQQIVDTFRPLINAEVFSKAGPGFPVEFIPCDVGDVIGRADDAAAALVEERGWLGEHVALLTTKHRHPVQVERDRDKAAYWADLWASDDIFYSTVAGFKGLERAAIVLAVNGFHDHLDPRNVLYAGMSRARDLLIVVSPPEFIAQARDDRLLRRLRRGTG